jgi:hypothetical protein
MTTAVQRRRGTSTEHATFTGLDGEITVNTTTYTAHIHDGATVGGVPLAKADGSNIVTSSIDINGGTIDGTVIGGTTPAAITGTAITATGIMTATGTSVFASLDISGDIDVDGTTNLDVVDIDGAVDMASTLTVAGTTNDGTTLAQITQSGTGRGFAVNRNVASATRAVVNLAQLQASGGAEAVLDIQQTTPASRAIKVTPDGSIDRFSVYGTGALVTTPVAGGHAVFNEGGVDSDFRVESDTQTHALFVDGGNNRVGIGESSPLVPLHLTTSSAGEVVRIQSDDAGGGQGPILGLYRNSSSPVDGDNLGVINFYGEDSAGNITTYAAIDSETYDVSNGTEDGRLTLRTAVAGSLTSRIYMNFDETVVNDLGANLDFRVESDTNANMLFVDGGLNKVGIGVVPVEGALTIKSAGNTYATSALVLEDTDSTTRSYITHVNGELAISNNGSTDQLLLKSTGALTVGGAVASTNIELNLNGVASKAQRIKFQESGVDKWLLGQGAASETSAFELYNTGGVIALSVDRTSNIATFQQGAVFNESGEDSDFRVESNDNSHQLAVDALKNNVQINNSNVVTNSDNGSVIVAKGAVYYSQVLSMPSPYTGNVQIDLDFASWGSNNHISAVDVMILTRQFGSTSGIAMGKMFATNSGSGGQFATFTTTDITTSNCTFTASSPNNYRLRLTVNPSDVTDLVSIVLTIPTLSTSGLSEITAQIV